MEVDSYVDEGFPKYFSIFLKKSILKTLKGIKFAVKYINLHDQHDIREAIDNIKEELIHKDEHV